MIEPTDKQMELIEKIEDALDVSFVDWCYENGRPESRRSASDFIDQYIDDYKHECGWD